MGKKFLTVDHQEEIGLLGAVVEATQTCVTG
jgi:hypothetical protein